jgi:hypothetical protein
MKKWTYDEAKQLLDENMIKHKGNSNYGEAFGAVVETVVEMINTKDGKQKKDEKDKESAEV